MLRKKLLLVTPPLHGLIKGFAGGVASLAEYLFVRKEELNVEIELLDFSLCSFDEIKIACIEYENTPDLIVGITTTTASYQNALYVAGCFKKSNKNCRVILGGPHASADYTSILLNHPEEIDYIISGEGEKALCAFLVDFPSVESVPNLIRIQDQRVIKNQEGPYLTNVELDHLPLNYISSGLYGQPGKFGSTTYLSARGCPLKCSFCAVSNQTLRTKSVSTVEQEIRTMIANGITAISVEDNFFAHSTQRTLELCKRLESVRSDYPSFSWDCQTRVESMKNPEVIKALENAGCTAVYLGVEALTTEHLLYLGKTENPERYLGLLFHQVLPALLDSDIECFINLQFGIPGSNASQIKETLNGLKNMSQLAGLKKKIITLFPQLHVVYPGTKHFFDGVADGRFKNDIFEVFTFWESCQSNLYSWIGENFAHGSGGIPEGILNRGLLKESKFQVETEKVLQIQNQISDIKRIPNIKIFEYRNFLI